MVSWLILHTLGNNLTLRPYIWKMKERDYKYGESRKPCKYIFFSYLKPPKKTVDFGVDYVLGANMRKRWIVNTNAEVYWIYWKLAIWTHRNVADLIFQTSVSMPRNAEIDESPEERNSQKILRIWKVQVYIHNYAYPNLWQNMKFCMNLYEWWLYIVERYLRFTQSTRCHQASPSDLAASPALWGAPG